METSIPVQLVALSNRLLGKTLTTAIIRPTFFAHFCAGENSAEVKHTVGFLQARTGLRQSTLPLPWQRSPVLTTAISWLQANGVGSILDYAAESDVQEEGPRSRLSEAARLAVARQYPYEGEATCDGHARNFITCVEEAAAASSGPESGARPFAAIK